MRQVVKVVDSREQMNLEIDCSIDFEIEADDNENLRRKSFGLYTLLSYADLVALCRTVTLQPINPDVDPEIVSTSGDSELDRCVGTATVADLRLIISRH
jgi:hypothetical protein